MNHEELRVVPIKNYVILGFIIIVSFLFIYYIYMWFDSYRETKLNIPILDRYLEVINYNELNDYLIENPDSIIYVSVLENSKIRDFEKKLKLAIKKNEIIKDILYMDITNDIDKINADEFMINDKSILDVPLVMVFDESKLINIYSVGDNDYDIDSFKFFVNNIRFSEEASMNG